MTHISISNLQRSCPVPSAALEALALKSIRRLKLRLPELSIVVAGPGRMRRINKEYLGHDYVTDVITFDHGEIIICPAEAVRNAKAFKTTVRRELELYVVHGLLHLAGYDDHSEKDIARMRSMEQELLK